MSEELLLYAVRNSDGHWFRAKGYGGYGDSWVPNLIGAKLYTRIAQARGRVTYLASDKNHPPPEIVELRVHAARVLDEGSRVAKVAKSRELKRAEEDRRERKREMERAKRALEDAQRKVAELEAKR